MYIFVILWDQWNKVDNSYLANFIIKILQNKKVFQIVQFGPEKISIKKKFFMKKKM